MMQFKGEKELIWVEKEFAEKYQRLLNEKSLDDQRLKVLDEYLESVTEESRKDFRANLDCLEEDVAIYKGLMLTVRQTFEKTKNEHLAASYELWENYDKELPSLKEKAQKMADNLNPLIEKFNLLNDILKQIKTYDMKNVVELIERLSKLYGEEKEMIEFLIKNYKSK